MKVLAFVGLQYQRPNITIITFLIEICSAKEYYTFYTLDYYTLCFKGIQENT